MAVSRNTVRAGIFVTISGILFIAVLLVLANAWTLFVPKATYVFRFHVNNGAAGLKKDSEVRIGGQEVGKVTAVDFARPATAKDVPGRAGEMDKPNAEAAPDGRRVAQYVYVTVALRKDMVLYRDAMVYLELPLLGSVSSINIPDVGGRGDAVTTNNPSSVATAPSAVLADWEILDGTMAPPSFLAQAGYGSDQKTQLQHILQRGSEIGDQVKSLVDAATPPVRNALSNVEEATADAKYITGTFRKQTPDWSASISKSLMSVQGATSEAEQRTIEAKAILAAIQSAIEDNRRRIDSIIAHADNSAANVEKLTDNVNKELYDKVKKGLDTANATVEESLKAGQKVNAFLDQELPGLELTLANMRLAGDQLKLALIEIRRSPWRLLYQPKRKEIEEELLYDSVRMYADAVSNLQAASRALENVTAAGAASNPQTQRQVEDLTRRLMEAFGDYEKASKAMLEQTMTGGGGK